MTFQKSVCLVFDDRTSST